MSAPPDPLSAAAPAALVAAAPAAAPVSAEVAVAAAPAAAAEVEEREFTFIITPSYTTSSMFHATTACVLMHYLLETEVLDARSFFTLTAEYSRRAAARALARRVAGRGIGGPFRARNKPGGDSSDDDDEAARAKARGMLDALPGPGTYAFSAQGVTSWRLTVEFASPPLVLPEAYSSADVARKVDVTLRLRAASACAARDAVEALYAAAAAHAEALRGDPSRTITVKVLSSSDHDSTVVLAKRSLDTIYLPAAIKTKARDEVAAFMASKKDYERFGIPYRRTFLLAGPPGLGKTSLIHALASEFSRDVYMISVGPKTTDESLRAALSEVRGRRGTFIVLEDVDALFTLEREIDKNRAVHALSFSGLLNALDGLGAPPGVLLFLTTNYLDRLDPALLRPGRVDTVLQFEPPSAAQVAEMVATLLPTLPAERREALLARMRTTPQCRGVSTAVLQKWLFDSRGCAEGPDVAVLVSLCDFYAERAAAAHRSAPSSVFA